MLENVIGDADIEQNQNHVQENGDGGADNQQVLVNKRQKNKEKEVLAKQKEVPLKKNQKQKIVITEPVWNESEDDDTYVTSSDSEDSVTGIHFSNIEMERERDAANNDDGFEIPTIGVAEALLNQQLRSMASGRVQGFDEEKDGVQPH